MKSILLIVTCTLASLSSPANATVVHAFQQEVTKRPAGSTYVVEQDGDYQIGLAWIEVITGGNDVLVEIARNNEIVKTLRASLGKVTRFETRLERLSSGDGISVTVKPDGGTFRMGYQLALATPTFTDLPVFDVRDYGAVGDGLADDMNAIRAAVAAAKAANGGIVRFEGAKTYRVLGRNDFTEEPVFGLTAARNVKVEGNGARMLLHPPDRFAEVADAENIHIDGFTIDYNPKPYYQGLVEQIDLATMTVDITVPERYPVPEIGSNDYRAPFFGRSFFADAPGARSGWGHNIYIERVTQRGTPRELRLHIRKDAKNSDTPSASMKPRLQYAKDRDATEFVVPHVRYGHRGGATRVSTSSRVKRSNLRYFCVPSFWLSITHNTGPITLSNVDLQTPQPETELFVSWRDGMHIKNGRWGILIEDGDWDGAAMYDDTFAIYSRAEKAVAVNGATVTLQPIFLHKEPFLWREGDWASIWTPDQSQLRGMSRVESVDGETGNNTFHVTLESMPHGSQPGDIVLHEESLNRGTVIRNCRTTDVGTENSSTRFRCVDVTFENNHFEDFHFWFHAGPNGPRPRDILLKGNFVSDQQGRSVNLDQGLDCELLQNTFDATAISCNLSETTHLRGNRFVNMNRPILRLKDSQVWLDGTNTVNSGTVQPEEHVELKGQSAVCIGNARHTSDHPQ